MEMVYKKLLEDLSKMTTEQKANEWESLKHFNDMGPKVEEYFIMVKGTLTDEPLTIVGVTVNESLYTDSCFYLAA